MQLIMILPFFSIPFPDFLLLLIKPWWKQGKKLVTAPEQNASRKETTSKGKDGMGTKPVSGFWLSFEVHTAAMTGSEKEPVLLEVLLGFFT